MSSLLDIRSPLDPDQFYHIYNRGNSGRLIFFQQKNYFFFLNKLKEYMVDYWDMYAFCLLPNHFHFLVKIKPKEVLTEAGIKNFDKIGASFLNKYVLTDTVKNNPDLLNFQNLVNLSDENYSHFFVQGNPEIFQQQLLQWIVSERFRRFLLAYAKSINKQENKSGSLFQKLFRRKHISKFGYLQNLVLYIHRNPVHHAKALEFMDWQWSSYLAILSNRQTAVKREEVLDWFGGRDNYVTAHQKAIDIWKNSKDYVIED